MATGLKTRFDYGDYCAQTLECYCAEAGVFRLVASSTAGTPLAHPDLPGFDLPRSGFWA